MSFFKWLLAGLAGAAVGGVAWVLIGYFANAEIGWIAWGIGLLAGLGARAAAGDSARGPAPGLAAVTAAVAVVALAKYAVVAMFVHGAIADQAAQGTPDFQKEELAIVYTADEIIDTEYAAAGKEVAWPENVTWEDADTEAEYPAEIWAAAKSKWTALSDAEKQTRRDTWRQNYETGFAAFQAELRSEAFAGSFSPYDLLWFGLAMFTAFQVGSGSKQVEPKPTVKEDKPQPAHTA